MRSWPLTRTVSRAPYSAPILPLVTSPAAGGAAVVVTATTPPIAWLPHGRLFAPRSTSIRSIVPSIRLPKSNPPPGDEGSPTRTPSMTTSVWSVSAPRIRRLVTPPSAPYWLSVTPGRRAISSAAVPFCARAISSASMIDSEALASSRASGTPMTVIAMRSSSAASAASAGVAAAKAISEMTVR